MRERIAAAPRSGASEGWTTVEAPLDLAARSSTAAGAGRAPVLVDCLTLWLTNLMLAEHDLAG